jgi:hypothetical protein
MIRGVLVALTLAACADPTVSMTLAPTADVRASLNTSCVSAVLVKLNGLNIDSSTNDFVQDCYDLPAGVTHNNWTELQAAISGKVTSPLPDTGLSGVEVYGYSGSCAQLVPPMTARTSDLAFYGFGLNDDDAVQVDVTGNLDCTRETVTARAIDIDKLRIVGSCDLATFSQAKGIGLATFNPLPIGRGVDWWGTNRALVDDATGLATIDAPITVLGSSCIAASWTNGSLDPRSTSCITPVAQNVCGAAREVPAIEPRLWEGARDLPKFGAYKGGFVVGIVYNDDIGPIAGASITLETGFSGEVVYLTRKNEEGAMVIRGADAGVTQTDITGLFGIYADSLIRVKIQKGDSMVTRNVGTAGEIPGKTAYNAAMIVKL